MRTAAAAAAGLSMLIGGAAAHGGLTFPPPRNNYGNTDPHNYTVPRCVQTPTRACSVRAGGPCAGGECLWFSEGCYIGCSTCSLSLPAGGNCSDTPCHNYYGEPACSAPELIEPTLPDEFRTWNIGNVSRRGDWTKYHPWRAPVRSFVPCPHGSSLVASDCERATHAGTRADCGSVWHRGRLLPGEGRWWADTCRGEAG